MRRPWVPLLLFTLLSLKAHAKECIIPWGEVFAKQAVEKIPAQNLIVSIAPFANDTGLKGDDWISDGVANLLIRYLNTNPGLSALPAKRTPTLPPQKPIRYKMGGLFQHTSDWLRIFVQLKDNQDNMILQFPIETPFPLHKRFFEGLREGAEKVFEKMDLKKINTQALKQIQDETSNVHSYENYTKGRLALETYDLNKIEVALIWFKEAKREDYQYTQAYQGLIDTYGFLSLYYKQKEEPYYSYLETIENILKESPKKKGQTLENRFLKAYVRFVAGTRALVKEDGNKAAEELNQALKFVPEDSLTAYYLAQSYAKLKNTELAGRYRSYAEEINPCLKR